MSKRSSPELNETSDSKKLKVTDVNSTYLHSSLRESGIILKRPPEKCIASHDTIEIIRNLNKNLESHSDYPRNLAEFFKNLEEECKDLEICKQYLFPNILRKSDGTEGYIISDSIIKILLTIEVLQDNLIDYIFEKTVALATESNCEPYIQMILKCFTSIHNIVNTHKISTNLINLLEVATERNVKLEILTAIPDIIGDQDHDYIATELSRILNSNLNLVPYILDTLSFLRISNDQYLEIQRKYLNIMANVSLSHYLPNSIKFLLMPGRTKYAYSEAVRGLRAALQWDNSIPVPEKTESQVFTAAVIRNSMISSKEVCSSWIKSISICKDHTCYRPIDFVILVIAYSTSEQIQKQIEKLLRKQIKLNILKMELLYDVVFKYKLILKEYVKDLIAVSNALLKRRIDPSIELFACRTYFLSVQIENCNRRIVTGLVQLGLDSKNCNMSSLIILNNIARRNIAELTPQAIEILSLLDRIDNMSLDEVRILMNLLCAVTFSFKDSVIRDDVHMMMRKKIGSSNLKTKAQGILAGVYAVRYLMQDDSYTIADYTRRLQGGADYRPPIYIPGSNVREAIQIIELLTWSTISNSDMSTLFHDELCEVIWPVPFGTKSFVKQLTEAATNDFQRNFIVESIAVDTMKGLKLTMQYGLNTDGEINEMIAINIAGLALDPKSAVNVNNLCPHFHLVQTLHKRLSQNNLSIIGALLGCPIVMPKFDINKIECMDPVTVTNILDCIVHCVNWFIEIINAFSTQNDEAFNIKVFKRILQIEKLETVIKDILIRSKISYKPPVCYYDGKKYDGELEMEPITAQGLIKDPGRANNVQTERSQYITFVENSLVLNHKMPFRQLNVNLMDLIKAEMRERDRESLSVKTLGFVLRSLKGNMQKVLLSNVKRTTVKSKQASFMYDAAKAVELVKTFYEVLPQLMEHLEIVTATLNKSITNQYEHQIEMTYTPALLDQMVCFECILNYCTSFFKWVGFQQPMHYILLQKSLGIIANSSEENVTVRVLLITIAQKTHTYEKYCLKLSTAISLMKFLKSLRTYAEGLVIPSILKTLALKFLSRQWKTPEGILEKGLRYNQRVDLLASIYFTNINISTLRNVTSQLAEDVKLLKSKDDILTTFKSVNKSNFPILFRNIGSALYNATTACLQKAMTNSEQLQLWKEVATAMKNMSEIAKVLGNKYNLTAFFKKSRPVLRIFMSQGFPILEKQFNSENKQVLDILKTLQEPIRFLQLLCSPSRLKNDTVFMSKVPYMKQLLETLICKIKAVLDANYCSEDFWVVNLENMVEDINGQVIGSPTLENEESDDQLPDDEDSDDTDDDLS